MQNRFEIKNAAKQRTDKGITNAIYDKIALSSNNSNIHFLWKKTFYYRSTLTRIPESKKKKSISLEDWFSIYLQKKH
jgi:hypothetical protein